MDEDLSIINANTRNEKIKNFFVNNKNKIILLFIIFVILIIAIYSFDKYSDNKKKEISNKFNLITIEYSDTNKDSTLNNLIDIIDEKDSTYSLLSLYFIIDNNLVSDKKKINNLFEIIINETSLDDEIKNLVILKKALFNADYIDENGLLETLKPLINSKTVWKSHALHLMAEYFYTNDQKEKAKEFYNKIINLENSNLEIKQQAQKRINRDLSE